MKKYINIFLVLVVVIAVAVLSKNEKIVEPAVVLNESIVGCYNARLEKDVYDLHIDSQIGENVSGFLTFNNFEKDSSSGPIDGTFKDNILLAMYMFESEGTTSVMQVIFKKEGNDFVRGYGDMSTTTNEFTDLNAISYDNLAVFKNGPCVKQE